MEGIIPADQNDRVGYLAAGEAGSAEALEPVGQAGGTSGIHLTLSDETGKDGAPERLSQGPESELSSPSQDVEQGLPPIVIGQDLAETLGAEVGDKVW